LRTPLTSLKSEIEVALRDERLTLPEAKKLLQSNLEEVDKMNALSDYLLRLNKYQAGEATLTFKPINLKVVAARAIEKVKVMAQSRKIKIIQELDSAKIFGNEDSLIELATIFLENAIKYNGQSRRVIFRTRKEGGEAILEVQDFGIGIKKEDIPHIFDRFFRADSSRSKRATDGYGLGLAIAKSIVELHAGKIRAESRVGKGSTFSASFKLV
jgi:signal transduction histidine kinase